MEKVKVIKAIPGILKVGDILISPEAGADFCLEETEVTQKGSSERYVSLDYVTVSENVPKFFLFEEFELADDEEECECTACECDGQEVGGKIIGGITPPYIVRSDNEVISRYDFFKHRFEQSYPGSEAQVVYKNLMWFIEWLNGKAEILA